MNNNSELPSNWTSCLMGDVADVVGGGTPSTKDSENFADHSGIAWLTPADLSQFNGIYVSRGRRFLTKSGYESSSAKLLPVGTVLFSSRAPIGYVAIAATEISTNQGFKSFICHHDIYPEYIYHYLKYAKPLVDQLASGSTFAEISGKRAAIIPLVLPPAKEQMIIAEKLTAIQGRLGDCRQRLDRIPYLLKRLRQSVFDAACSGRLTEHWRKQGQVSTDEITDQSEVPESWSKTSLSAVCTDFRYGTSSKSHPTGDIPVLRMGNIQSGRIDWTDLVFTSDPKEIEKYSLDPGSVLFNRTNSPELVGKTAIYMGERPAIFAGYLILILPNHDVLLPEYLNYCLNTSSAKQYCSAVKSDGVSQSNINAKKIAAFQISLPPINEQREIVDVVGRLLTLTDEVETRFNEALKRIYSMMPSTLAKAFRGELVPQDPDDDPAEKLLERIKAERAKSTARVAEGEKARAKKRRGSPGRAKRKRSV